MSNVRPAFQFYPGDWRKDPCLRMCSPATRGIWIDLLCMIHESETGFSVTGTIAQLSRACGCTPEEMASAIDELDDTNTATVTLDNEKVTVISRRLEREKKARDNNALRQKRHKQKRQGNEEVTPISSSSSSSLVTTEIKQGSDKSSLISPNQGADARDEKQPSDDQKTPRKGTRHGELARLLIEKGVAVTSQHPDLIDWASEGLTDAEAIDCVSRARLHKPEPERIPAKYLNPIVRQVIAERNRPPQASTGPPRYGGKTEAIRQRNETNVNAWLGEDDQAIDGEFHAVQ
jgi:hypothetical protein